MREDNVRDRYELAEGGIIHPELADNAAVQAFREIRTRIVQRTQGRSAVVLVTSAAPKSGNSFVTLNLAVAFAFDAGRTALLMDADLKNATLQRLLPDPDMPGLTDYVENAQLDVASVIHPVGIQRLRLIPAGRCRGIVEHFTSERLRRLLGEIRNRYSDRFVFIDAPPMASSADTRILAELSDFVLVVVPYGKASSDQIENCVKSIDPAKFLGMVLNDDPRPPHLEWRNIRTEMLASFRGIFNGGVNRIVQSLRSVTKRQAKTNVGQ